MVASFISEAVHVLKADNLAFTAEYDQTLQPTEKLVF
jgi:hypothetical protein